MSTRRILSHFRHKCKQFYRLPLWNRLAVAAMVLCLLVILYLNYRLHVSSSGVFSYYSKEEPVRYEKHPIQSTYTCPPALNESGRTPTPDTEFLSIDHQQTDKKVLVLVETLYSPIGKQVVDVFNALRLRYKVQVLGKSLPLLTTLTKGRFSLVVIENYYKYLNLDDWNRQLLDKYCKDYGVALLGFMLSRPDAAYSRAKVRGFPFHIVQHQRVTAARWNPASSALYIAKAGRQLELPPRSDDPARRSPADDDWLTFVPDHETFESILLVRPASGDRAADANFTTNDRAMASAVTYDRGAFDGLRRVLFGYGLKFWMVKLAFVDAVRLLTNGRLSAPLTRYLQVDIDDVFVGPKGVRMTEDDVRALIAAQSRIQSVVPGFVFHLGFSGKYFQIGLPEENSGDRLLIESSAHFRWFPHMWRHNQAHRYNSSALEAIVLLNRHFAQTHGLNLSTHYAVAPHHAGVYPVHAALYDVWRRVYDVRVTSTEEYPRFKPASLRRGFVHNDIMVLPRQTCGIYTHTMFSDKYPGGFNVLEDYILGGDLFFTFVLNPYLAFMTHFTNYGNDRLGSYTFETAIKFIQCWTNLHIRGTTPTNMARMYFQTYRNERQPIWGNPCLDKRHLEIWDPNKDCNRFPRALIIGPQKTGTTALFTFLKLHPAVRSSRPSADTFEEVQFFGGKNYAKGIDWYMDFFDATNSSDNTADALGTMLEGDEEPPLKYLFEKSATYFDAPLAPPQAHALLPNAMLIAILSSPVTRAYSWYQHQLAKGDPTATKRSFEQILSEDTGGRAVKKLRKHCLNPGKYAMHLEKWLEHYASNRLMVIDGEVLKTDPVTVMMDVQRFLGLKPEIDYSKLLIYDARKGFFCAVSQPQESSADNQTAKQKHKCLGRSKGRAYAPMRAETRRSLLRFYRPYNIALHRLLTKHGLPTPTWLREHLAEADVQV